MADSSKIEWTDATWNPVTGCEKISQGCKNCYAKRDWARLSAPREKPNIYTGRKFEDVMVHPERLDQPMRWTKPRRIFVNSMSDLFHEDVDNYFIAAVFGIMAASPQHTFQVLTKRPERMLEWFKWMIESRPGYECVDPRYMMTSAIGRQPVDYVRDIQIPATWPLPNVWIGISVEDQGTADERIPLLLKTPAAVRWLSAEPLLGPVFLYDWTRKIDWVVAGGESGPNARPSSPNWFRQLRDQCVATGVPYFFKQWGEWRLAYGDSEGERAQVCEFGIGAATTIEPGRRLTPFESIAGAVMQRVGKKLAGRELDGRTWDEYPGSPYGQQ